MSGEINKPSIYLDFYSKIVESNELGLSYFFENLPHLNDLQDRFTSFARCIDSKKKPALPDVRSLQQLLERLSELTVVDRTNLPEDLQMSQDETSDESTYVRTLRLLKDLNISVFVTHAYDLTNFLSDLETYLTPYQASLQEFLEDLQEVYLNSLERDSEVSNAKVKDLQIRYRNFAEKQPKKTRLPMLLELSCIGDAFMSLCDDKSGFDSIQSSTNLVENMVAEIKKRIASQPGNELSLGDDLVAFVVQRIVWGLNNDIKFDLKKVKEDLRKDSDFKELNLIKNQLASLRQEDLVSDVSQDPSFSVESVIVKTKEKIASQQKSGLPFDDDLVTFVVQRMVWGRSGGVQFRLASYEEKLPLNVHFLEISRIKAALVELCQDDSLSELAKDIQKIVDGVIVKTKEKIASQQKSGLPFGDDLVTFVVHDFIWCVNTDGQFNLEILEEKLPKNDISSEVIQIKDALETLCRDGSLSESASGMQRIVKGVIVKTKEKIASQQKSGLPFGDDLVAYVVHHLVGALSTDKDFKIENLLKKPIVLPTKEIDNIYIAKKFTDGCCLDLLRRLKNKDAELGRAKTDSLDSLIKELSDYYASDEETSLDIKEIRSELANLLNPSS